MRFLPLFLGALCLSAILCACTTVGQAPEPEGLRLWYLAQEGTSALGWEAFAQGQEDSAVPRTDELIMRLLEGPRDSKLASPFPAGLRLLDWAVDDGVLTLDLSEGYGALSGVALTAADACLTLTLCQLEGVTAVCTMANGAHPPGRALHVLRPNDIILSGAGEEPVYVVAVLYYPRLEGRGLGVEHRAVLVPEGSTVSAAIAGALLSGAEGDALGAPVPAGTRLLGASVAERICHVNLSAEFRDGLPARQEDAHLLIYSLVDTLGNLENVDAVQILVEGQPPDDYHDIPLSRPLEPDFRLIEE